MDDGFENIRFAWAGPTARGSGPHYYRIQGPRFLIEYDASQDDGNQCAREERVPCHELENRPIQPSHRATLGYDTLPSRSGRFSEPPPRRSPGH